MPLWKRALRRLLAIACGLVAALVLLEIGLRVMGELPRQRNSMRAFHDPHPLLGWAGAPDYSARFQRGEFDVRLDHGPDGFRRPQPDPPEGSPEILFLGDSFTWGFGLPQGATYADVLQRELGKSARVLNRGVNGYSTGQQLLLLEQLGAPEPPGVVVVAFYFNDLFENGDPWTDIRPWFRLEGKKLVRENIPPASALSGALNPITRRSRALTWIGFVANRIKHELDPDPLFEAHEVFPLDSAGLDARFALHRAILEELRTLCEEADVELRVLYIPAYFDLVERDELGDSAVMQTIDFGGRLAQTCEELGIPFLDPRAALLAEELELGARGAPLYFTGNDHWTALGHRIVGNWLATELEWPRAAEADELR